MTLASATGVAQRSGVACHRRVVAWLSWAISCRLVSRAAASILGDEAMHWAILRQVLGEDPVPAAFVG